MIRITQDGQRRRGAELESAILAATIDELRAVGYAQLSMEGVAARAQTGKQVLYRRWRNRADLVLAAVRREITEGQPTVPDTGALRTDLLDLLRQNVRRFEQVPIDAVHGLMADAAELPPEVRLALEERMMAILRRAADRGEVGLDGLTPRIVSLPFDLVRHDLLLRGRKLDDAAIGEIVDVFLRLLPDYRPADH